MAEREYHTIAYVKDIAIVKRNNGDCCLIDINTNEVVAPFDNFFSFEIEGNRLIFQYKVNKVRLFDIKTKEIILENADCIAPHAIYKTSDNFYHAISYFEAFDTLTHLIFQDIKEIGNGFYAIKTESGYGIYHINYGIIAQPIYYEGITIKNNLVVLRRNSKDTVIHLTIDSIKNKKGNILTFDHVEIDDNFKIIYAFTNNVIHCYSVSDEGELKELFFIFDFDTVNPIYNQDTNTFNIKANSLSSFTINEKNYKLVNGSLQKDDDFNKSKTKVIKPPSCNF